MSLGASSPRRCRQTQIIGNAPAPGIGSERASDFELRGPGFVEA